MKSTVLGGLFCLCTGFAVADSPVIEKVTAIETGRSWTFHVTVRHGDTGWDHYANGWGVYLEDGTELGYRVLHHPHVNEQPFTRSLSLVVIPGGVKAVKIVPRDSVHGTGEPFRVVLEQGRQGVPRLVYCRFAG